MVFYTNFFKDLESVLTYNEFIHGTEGRMSSFVEEPKLAAPAAYYAAN